MNFMGEKAYNTSTASMSWKSTVDVGLKINEPLEMYSLQGDYMHNED